MLFDLGGRGWVVASVLDFQSLFFFIKENFTICTMTRHHAEQNNILLT